MSERKAGALLSVASLPSSYGIGDFGGVAYKFIDLLVAMKMKIWQVLPLNPLGFGNSPYQAYSSFAGDELYISIDQLIACGLLAQDQAHPLAPTATSIDYVAVKAHKASILRQAYHNFKHSSALHAEFANFKQTTPWLHNYVVFITFKKINQLRLWTQWPAEYKNWIKDPSLVDLTPYQAELEYEMFLQFIFFRQWYQLKDYANQHGIEIMGDIPIYIGLDSLDVWENQEIFLLDNEQNPTYIAGVPPDFFSETGQRWGNPLYDWDKLEASGFKFWIERLRGNAKAFDIIRIDHFRAFDTYWKIPASCPTAIEGEWIEAPGYALFDTIYQELPNIKIVAEDLGDLRKEVLELRDHYQLKGMKIFQFIFEPQLDNSLLEQTVNTIIYSGTHDNSTLMGWYQALSAEKQHDLRIYFDCDDSQIKDRMLAYILNCQAEYAILPLQDILGLPESARFNTPGTIGAPNWEWKLADFEALREVVAPIAALVKYSQRSE